jgi:hypothetical protein
MSTLPNLTSGQDGTNEEVFQGLTALDYVFDEFLAAETLAFILSPPHMIKALLRLSMTLDRESAKALNAMLANPSELTKFHLQLLEKVSGFHVEEACIEEVDQLMQVLDERYDAGWMGDETEHLLARRWMGLPKSSLNSYCESTVRYLAFYQKGHWSEVPKTYPH